MEKKRGKEDMSLKGGKGIWERVKRTLAVKQVKGDIGGRKAMSKKKKKAMEWSFRNG